ncbi:MAG TPA: polysaccharide deacetylase family protein [Chthonomonadaceae bacterium]|nr:polysaccharide deacetylase family protein [Chthonomonadaceae bacterium]
MRAAATTYANCTKIGIYAGIALLYGLTGAIAHAQSGDEKPAIPPGSKPHDQINHWQGDKILSLWRGDPYRKEIALTFDDGPHPPFTQRLLALLKQLDVRATFFLVGKKVDQAPGVVDLIAKDGHEVANHTYHHLNLDAMTEAAAANEIRLGNEAIKRACGRTPAVFRPPGGHHNPHILRAAKSQNVTVILWTDDPADFANPGADVIGSRILEQIGCGANILLHDGVEQTLEMLPDLVARLRRDGYKFVTMSEMIHNLEARHIANRQGIRPHG